MDNENNPLNFRLTRGIRLTIMIALISLFFIISPLLVLYTSGYRYNWDEHRLEGTGVISIDASPTDAIVKVNDIKIEKSLPIWLPNIAPDVYKLSIEKPGYKTWSEDVYVTGNQTTYIKNISLIKDNTPKLKNIGAQKIEQISSPEGYGALTILQKNSEKQALIHLNPITNIVTPIIELPLTVSPELSFSPQKNLGTISYKNKNKTEITLFSFKEPYHKISYTYKNDINYAWIWPNNNPTIYIQSDSVIEKVESDLSKRTIGVSTSTIWYVDADNNIWSVDKNTITNNIKDGVNKYDLDRPIQQIIDINKSRMILRYDQGLLIVRLQDGKNVKQKDIGNAIKINYHPDTGEWWAWSDWELWSVYQDGSSFLLNRSSEKITNALPMDSFGVILIVSGNSLYSFNPGYYTNQKIGTFDAIESIDVNRELKKIYFSGMVGGVAGLYELEY